MVYLFLAYTIIWLGVALYVFNIAAQHKKLQRQLEALEGAVAGQAPGRAAGAGAKGGAGRS